MAGHGAGVTEAEVDVMVAVDVGETRAVGFGDEDRKFAGPFFHPVHGDAAEEGFLGAFVERGGFGMGRDEIIFFAGQELVETGAIDGGGGARFAGLRHEWLRSVLQGGAGAVENIAKEVGNWNANYGCAGLEPNSDSYSEFAAVRELRSAGYGCV